ncbi:hypothetical protein [Nonomuraea jabiensis]|uniref:hypothetical protein n=1 Tax=Nonomuraea jabiensis TaxID=882448 RepID=UPI003D70E7E9
MTARVGDFLHVARQHLCIAAYDNNLRDFASLDGDRAAMSAAAELLTALHRLSSFTRPRPGASAHHISAHARSYAYQGRVLDTHVYVALGYAATLLHPSQQLEPSGEHLLAAHLRAAALANATAADLLDTHYAPSDAPTLTRETVPGNIRPTRAVIGTGRLILSDWARVIDSPQVRDALMQYLGEQIASVIPVLNRLASRRLQRGASLQAESIRRSIRSLNDCVPLLLGPATAEYRAPANAVLAFIPPLRQVAPQAPGERAPAQPQLCRDIIDNAEALRQACFSAPRGDEKQPLNTYQAQHASLAASIISHCATQLCRILHERATQLADHGAETLPPQTGATLHQAQTACSAASIGWRHIHRLWAQLPLDAAGGRTNDSLQHLEHLVLRLGRLLYINPAWTPARRDASATKTAKDLAPHRQDVATIALGLYHTLEALTALAKNHLVYLDDWLHTAAEIPPPPSQVAAHLSIPDQLQELAATYRKLIAPQHYTTPLLGDVALWAQPLQQRDQLLGPLLGLQLRDDQRYLDELYNAEEQAPLNASAGEQATLATTKGPPDRSDAEATTEASLAVLGPAGWALRQIGVTDDDLLSAAERLDRTVMKVLQPPTQQTPHPSTAGSHSALHEAVDYLTNVPGRPPEPYTVPDPPPPRDAGTSFPTAG